MATNGITISGKVCAIQRSSVGADKTAPAINTDLLPMIVANGIRSSTASAVKHSAMLLGAEHEIQTEFNQVESPAAIYR
jgi:hypothetical protein